MLPQRTIDGLVAVEDALRGLRSGRGKCLSLSVLQVEASGAEEFARCGLPATTAVWRVLVGETAEGGLYNWEVGVAPYWREVCPISSFAHSLGAGWYTCTGAGVGKCGGDLLGPLGLWSLGSSVPLHPSFFPALRGIVAWPYLPSWRSATRRSLQWVRSPFSFGVAAVIPWHRPSLLASSC